MIPEYLDTDGCLCGLVTSPAPHGQSLLWRCIANESGNIATGTSGKWYNTTITDLVANDSGEILNTPRNGPKTTQAYVWVNNVFSPSTPNSSSLTQADRGCTGDNDTASSTTFLEKQNGTVAVPSTTSSFSSSMPTVSLSSTPSSTSPLSSAAQPTPTPNTTPKSSACAVHTSMKAILLAGMLLTPLTMAWL